MYKQSKKRILQVLNLVAPLLAAAITLTLGGSESTGDVFVEESLPKLLNPAPITFAIWGPIFILMGLFYIYQARDLLPGVKEVDMPFLYRVNVFFLLSTIMSSVWFVTWSRRMIWASVGAMILYLITILAAYFRLRINLLPLSRQDRLLVTAGWSMYAGWVTAAALVSIATGFVYYGFENLPFSEVQWTVSAIVAAVVVYLAFLFCRRDYVFAGVGVWTLIGLCITHLGPAPSSNYTIFITSIVGATIIILSMLLSQWLKIRKAKALE